MKKIAIYGAGSYGKKVISILKNTNQIYIILVCDSDEKKWGKKCEGYTISRPDQIFVEKDIDGVFISILSDNDVDKYILNKRKVKIYKEIYELVAETLYWDISGKCNAKCKYCVTGRYNRKYDVDCIEKLYINLETFKKNYEQLFEKGIISKETFFGLYSWNEPFLNPEIIDILSYCSEMEQKYIISTNGSIFRAAKEKNTYFKCKEIYFSMPGFSQESYDRIHRFSFNAIKKNITRIREDMLAHGFEGRFIISAHIYRFSEKEIDSLIKWAEEEGMEVNAYYPYLAGNSLILDYFENRLDERLKKDISEELFFNWNNAITQEKDFINPLCHQVTIDEKCNFTLCCCADKFCDSFDNWGKIEDIDSYEEYRELKKKMLKSKTCMQCKKYAMAYRILYNHRE